MSLKVEKLGQSCGAQISGIDLKKDLSESTIREIINRVKSSLTSLNITHEIIVIDDKSNDKTKIIKIKA